MSTEPEAIRLASLLQDEAGVDGYVHDEAAAELRRLHAENEHLQACLNAANSEAEADEELMREARDALQYHVEQTRPIDRTSAALARLSKRVGE